MNRIGRDTLFGVSLLIASASGHGSAFGAQKFGTRVDVTAVEVSASVRDASGHVPRDLTPGDFVLLEDGKPQRIIGVAYNPAGTSPTSSPEPPPAPDHPRQIVVFLQQALSTTDGLRLSLNSLTQQAGKLVAMGEVEVVTDDPSPHSLIGPTRDESALRALFQELGNEALGKEDLIRMRMEFTTSDQMTSDKDDRLTRRYLALKAARHEWLVLRTRQDAMLAWLSRYPRHGSGDATRALVFVTDGFDLAPASYYRLDPDDLRADVRMELRELNASAHQDEIARALAAQGWTILSFATGSRVNRVIHFAPAIHDPRPIREFGDVVGNVRPRTINKAPLDPLKRLAEATGGSVLTDPSKLGDQLEDLEQRVVITYQVDRPSDDKLRHVEIRAARAGLTVNAQKWVGSGSTMAMTEVTAAVLATAMASSDVVEHGELPVTCSLKLGSMAKGIRTSEIEIRVSLASIDSFVSSLESGTLRFTLAVVAPNAPPFTSTNRLEHLDFSAKQEWTTTMTVRHRDGATMAVIAEESSTGEWGGCSVRP